MQENPHSFKALFDYHRDRTFQVLFLGFMASMAYLGRMAWGGIRSDADAWYGQKAKEMMDFASPYIVSHNGQPSFEHVPFPIWVESFYFKLFGVSSYSAVLPSALWGICTVFLIYHIAQHLFKSRWIGFIAAMILIFPGYYMENARRGHLDATLGFLVTLAVYAFIRGKDQPRWYLLYGLSTGCAVLTKSLLGLFPYGIGLAYLLVTCQFKRIFHPWLVFSVTLGTVIGFSWHVYSWVHFGQEFYNEHFSAQMFNRYSHGNQGVFTYLFYPRQLMKNYWPWLPLLIWGLFYFFTRAIKEKDYSCIFVLAWLFTIYGVVGGSQGQQLQYFISAFPPLALIIAKTVHDKAGESWRRRLSGFLIVGLMLSVFIVDATGFQPRNASSLRQKSRWTRDLAPVINLNTRSGETLGNLKLSQYEEPGSGLIFYADRMLNPPLDDYETLMQQLALDPKKTWFAPMAHFQKMLSAYPGKLYLIQGNSRYAFFTSMKNRENIRYDFSEKRLTYIN